MIKQEIEYKIDVCKIFPDKVAFDTYYAAERVLKTHQKGRVYGKSKRKFATKNLKRVYKCPECKKYHLTSKI